MMGGCVCIAVVPLARSAPRNLCWCRSEQPSSGHQLSATLHPRRHFIEHMLVAASGASMRRGSNFPSRISNVRLVVRLHCRDWDVTHLQQKTIPRLSARAANVHALPAAQTALRNQTCKQGADPVSAGPGVCNLCLSTLCLSPLRNARRIPLLAKQPMQTSLQWWRLRSMSAWPLRRQLH